MGFLKGEMNPSAEEFQPESNSRHLLIDPCGLQMTGASLHHMSLAPQVLWVPSFDFEARAPVESKALVIRNPKTGEIIGAPAAMRPHASQPTEQGASPEVSKDSSKENRINLAGGAKWNTDWSAAASLIASRMRRQKLRSDHSTFSALNLDSLKQSPASSPLPEALRLRLRGSGLTSGVLLRPCKLPSNAAPKGEESPVKPEDTKDGGSEERSTSAGESSQPSSCAAVSETNSSEEPEESTPEEASASVVPVEQDSLNEAFFQSVKRSKRKTPKSTSPDVAVKELAEQETPPKLSEKKSTAEQVGQKEEPEEQAVSSLLRFRFAVADETCPAELDSLSAEVQSLYDMVRLASVVDEEEDGLQPSGKDFARTMSAPSAPPAESHCDRSLFGSRRGSRPDRVQRTNTLPAPSLQAYRPGATPKTPQEGLTRTVQSLLNKVCPESVATICEKISEVKVENTADLEIIISLIFKKALSEPHYVETYADLVFGLKPAFPEFASTDGGKPVSFKSTLLNICQAEFDALPTSMEPTSEELELHNSGELEFRRKQTKARVLANIKLIGHLFLRQLLSAKVIGSIIQELTLCGSADQVPEEHVIECAVELLMSIGHTLESMSAGKIALGQVCGRFKDLKQRVGLDKKPVYGKRIQFAIQDLLEVRAKGWTRKVFSGVAKTKEEIRREQQMDLKAQAMGKDVEVAEKVVAGARPLYIAAKKD